MSKRTKRKREMNIQKSKKEIMKGKSGTLQTEAQGKRGYFLPVCAECSLMHKKEEN